jgi:hypothetical protein
VLFVVWVAALTVALLQSTRTKSQVWTVRMIRSCPRSIAIWIFSLRAG